MILVYAISLKKSNRWSFVQKKYNHYALTHLVLHFIFLVLHVCLLNLIVLAFIFLLLLVMSKQCNLDFSDSYDAICKMKLKSKF